MLLLLADREWLAVMLLNALTIHNRVTSKLPFGNDLLTVLMLRLCPEAAGDMEGVGTGKQQLALAKTVPGPS